MFLKDLKYTTGANATQWSALRADGEGKSPVYMWTPLTKLFSWVNEQSWNQRRAFWFVSRFGHYILSIFPFLLFHTFDFLKIWNIFIIKRNMSKLVNSVHTTQTHPCKPHKQHKQCILHIYTHVRTDSETCVVQPQTAGGVWGVWGVMTNISFTSLKNNSWVLKGQL